MTLRVAMMLLLSNGLAFAGSMGSECAPGHATVPCATPAWDLGMQALYLKKLSNNNAFHSSYNIGSASGTRLYSALDNRFEWGVRVDGAYHFNSGNEVRIDWLHWTDRNSPRLGFTGIWAPDPVATFALRIASESRFDAVNVALGQQVDFGHKKNIRFYAGLQFAQIDFKQTEFDTVSGSVLFPEENGTIRTLSTQRFSGAGPRIGADMSYDVDMGFSVYGNAAAALLVGRSRASDNAPFTDSSRPVRSQYDTAVPEIEAKLGGKYTVSAGEGRLTVDAGYMVMHYYHPLHFSNLDLLRLVEYRDHIDFALHGPYAGIHWLGNL
ncbi:MAG: hypothetical protein JJT82_01265 [Legionellaceae bacterium]|nr:hypothetical protein [Legionellaceae bacterium]